MAGLLIEENNNFGIDCSKALWATDEMHNVYGNCCKGFVMSDVDFSVETQECIILIEFKNANAPQAISHSINSSTYNPLEDNNCKKIVRKYYDALHFLHLLGKDKPFRFVFVIEYPKGNPSSRKMLRNRLKEMLPFKLQDHFDAGIKLIESVSVLSIDEWNSHEYYGQFPIIPIT